MDAYTIFTDEAVALSDTYPNLRLDVIDGIPVLSGAVTLYDSNVNIEDSYQIRLSPTADYPRAFPYVYETDGRIPHNIDWHVYDDGHFCIASPPEENIICHDGISLGTFLKNQVEPYLFNQTFRRKNGYFLKERSHGAYGWLEFFFELLKTQHIPNVVFFLKKVLEGAEPLRTANCICGNKEKYRNCHRHAFRELRKLKDNDIAYYITLLDQVS